MPTVVHDTSVWLPRTNTWIYNEIAGLDDRWTPWVIANRSENRQEFPFGNVYSLRDEKGKAQWFIEMLMRRSTLFSHAPSITRFAKSLKPDILHSHFGTTGWRNLKLARTLKAAHVVTFYGFDVTRTPRNARWRERYAKLFDEVDLILCEGPHMAATIESLGCSSEKISVHQLGVRLDKLPYKPRTPNANHVRFLMAGSFREKKGLTDGLLALIKLRETKPEQGWDLTIVGGSGGIEEGELIEQELKRLASEHGVTERVNYTGYLSHDELIEQGKEHDVFLCPSVKSSDGDTEGGAPVVMIEMAALGLQIAATSHCDMPYVLGEKNRKLLVPEKDTDALSRSLAWLLDRTQKWKELSRDNREHIEACFDHATQGERLTQLYDSVSSGR